VVYLHDTGEVLAMAAGTHAGDRRNRKAVALANARERIHAAQRVLRQDEI
jgi:hypothetical protein